MFPKIKDSISVLYRRKGTGYEVNFLLNNSSVIIPFELNEAAFSCLQYLDGMHSLEQIVSSTGLHKHEVIKLVSALNKARILCKKQRTEAVLEDSRFKTQLNFFSEFETSGLSREEMQDRLKSSLVTIIGLGGIGTWVAYGLALAGVGQLTLVDPDVVELSNLNRQCLFTRTDVGRSKAVTIAHKLAEFNPDLQTRILLEKILCEKDCLIAVQGADLIINCADEPRTDAINRIVTQVGYTLNIPHILCGGYDGHLSFLGPTIIPGKSACWYCYERMLNQQLDQAGYEHLLVTPAHVQGGNIASISAITANYHTLEAIKILTNFAIPAMLNKTAELDFLTFEIHFRNFKKHRSCTLCGHTRKTKPK